MRSRLVGVAELLPCWQGRGPRLQLGVGRDDPQLLLAGQDPVAELGTPLHDGDLDSTGGVDAKWIPNTDNALDLTLNPDFSQVESDVTRISANERFAIFYPEKRPFFLEGMELYSTSIAAVYTRTLTLAGRLRAPPP